MIFHNNNRKKNEEKIENKKFPPGFVVYFDGK